MKLPKAEQATQLSAIRAGIASNNKIGMIKAVRTISPGMGLAEAKTLVERHMLPGASAERIFNGIRGDLREYLTPVFTKEQFMSALGEMIDKADVYFEDPLDAVIRGCQNLKERGGLEYIASRDEQFIDSV